MIPKSPLAQESEKTQKELARLLNTKENKRVRASTSEATPQDRIYFKVKHSPLKQTQNNSVLTPAMAVKIASELKGETEGCLTQGSLDTHMWNGIRARIRNAGLEVKPAQTEAVVSKAKVKRMSMANNKSN